MKYFWLAIVFCLFPATVAAQHEHTPTETKPAALMPGLGSHHHSVSTRNAEAQRFFDQGLTLIFAFNHSEAARSFARAAELDPQLAMAHWGIALAVGPNYNEAQVNAARVKAAYDAIHQALLRSASNVHDARAYTTPEQERAYIAALAKRYSIDPKVDVKKLAVEYKDAMKELAQRYPDDLDAAVLYAESLMDLHPWQLWAKDGKPTEGTEEIVAVLEAVLKRDPTHIGANHFYIHAVEASRQPERALPSAARLGNLAPAAGHLVHMPAHIYIRTGDYEAAAKSNEGAAAADRAYIKSAGVQGMYPAMYYSHNLHFLVEAYNRSGQFQEAQRAAAQLAENVAPYVKEMPMLEGFLPSVTFVLMRFGHWDEILKSPEPERALAATNTIWHFARGAADAATGQVAEAQAEQRMLAAAIKNIPGDTPFGLNSASSVLKIAEYTLEARIAWAKGDKKAAVEAWHKAVEAQDALNYDEPPGWYYPVRESLGGALLLSGDAAGAERVFRADLEQNPRNGRSLFGLMESLKAQGKQAAAQLVQREFEVAWKNADAKLRVEDL